MRTIYFRAPDEDREEILAMGGEWSESLQCWMIPPWQYDGIRKYPSLPELFLQWLHETIPYEGIKGVGGLCVDLIPYKCHYSNIRTILRPEDWEAVSAAFAKANDNRCAICKGRGSEHPVEAHERWTFDVSTKTQRLKCIQSLCPACHLATHYGFAQSQGKGSIARNQLKHVNGWDDEDVDNHLMRQYSKCRTLNKTEWLLDMSWLIGKAKLSDQVIQTIEHLKNGLIERPKNAPKSIDK